MRGSAVWLWTGASALVVLACNEILDNRKGVLWQEPAAEAAAPTQPDDPGGEIATRVEDEVDAGAMRVADAAPAPRAEVHDDCPPRIAGPAGRAAPAKRCGSRCVSTDDPSYGCGATDCAPCDLPSALATCARGSCAVLACKPGRADCNGDPRDGCEADLSSLATCGSCSDACLAPPHATATCSLGCTYACEPGWGDCNGDPLDGCETDVASDPAHCGQCRRSCLLGECLDGGCLWF